jgi:hypothetical protein
VEKVAVGYGILQTSFSPLHSARGSIKSGHFLSQKKVIKFKIKAFNLLLFLI